MCVCVAHLVICQSFGTDEASFCYRHCCHSDVCFDLRGIRASRDSGNAELKNDISLSPCYLVIESWDRYCTNGWRILILVMVFDLVFLFCGGSAQAI